MVGSRAAAERRDPWVAVLGAAAVLQVVVTVAWAVRSGASFGEDFDVHYAATRLLLTGHRDAMYSPPAQLAVVHAQGDPALGGLNHAGWGPAGLVSVMPFTALPVPAAVAAWTVAQLAALSAAVLLALRVARPAAADARRLALAAALAAPGLSGLVVLGQWEGFASLLLVLSWLDARGERRRRSAGWLLLLAGALPQLVAAVFLVQLGRWGWGHLRTLAAGGAALAAASLALLGTSGIAAWLGQVGDLWRESRPQDADGLNALAGAALGGGTAEAALAGLLTAVAGATAWAVARLTRRGTVTATTAAGAVILSLLLSTHLFHYALPALMPFAVGALVAEGEPRRRRVMLLAYALLGVLSVAGLHAAHPWWQPAVPLTLVALLLVCAMPALRSAWWAAHAEHAAESLPSRGATAARPGAT